MERLEQLISKLKGQFEQHSSPAQMLVTVKQIESELSHSSLRSGNSYGTAKVAVVMPSPIKNTVEAFAPMEVVTEQVAEEPVRVVEEIKKVKEAENWLYDPLKEIPTLAQQPKPKELNDIMGTKSESLNDRLNASVAEVAHAIKDSPVHDLRKAIGVNDRYVFINDLFRGDEVMYERSIKTINNFKILPEAEYWMERELKLKLGWDEGRETVKHFFQLVKRRFS
jgi:hypothetical protein